MIKEIKYNGFTSVPSDYECQDGDLAASINIVLEDGQLKIINQPFKELELAPYRCIAVHNVAGADRLILWLDSPDGGGDLYARPRKEAGVPALISSGFDSVPSVGLIGNVIVVSDGRNTAYVIYSAEKECYVSLGSSIPEVSVSLALSHAMVDESYADYVTLGFPEAMSMEDVKKILPVFSRPGREVVRRSNATKEDVFFNTLSDAVLGFLNKMNVKAAEENKFIHPFLIRWALRLYDGSYVHQSAPVLMVPNSAMPPIAYAVGEEEGLMKINLKSFARRCSLMFRPSGLDALALWKDVVKSIDFFVSLPVYTYDQSGSVEAVHRTGDDASVFSHSGLRHEVGQTRGDEPSEGGNHRHPLVIDPDKVSLYGFPDGNREVWGSGQSQALMPPRFSREHIESGIASASAFYLIASLPLSGEEAVSDYEGFVPLDLNDSALSNLAVRPQLPDDWRSHDVVHFRSAYPYNSRLSLANISSSVFSGFPLPSMAQFSCDPEGEEDSGDVPCVVWVRLVRSYASFWLSVPTVLQGGVLPRFLYYPDFSAVEMRIIKEDGSGWRLPLKPHDFLNGAYWFDGLSKERTDYEDVVEVPVASVPVVEEISKVYLSEVNNPFFFPVSSRVSVGDGRVRALSSAAKALSQGQFGQFPLYAFTTDGVWAMEVSANGTFSAKQPITRDVCVNPDGITQIDSAVLFPTDRGIMLISGSQTQCISDVIANDVEFDVRSLPGMDQLHAMIGHGEDSCFPVVPFLDFISSCGMVYDYLHQRIIVFNKGYSYAYVYSLKSKKWGMTFSNIADTVNSYPEALAVDNVGRLVDFSQVSEEKQMGLLVTRPIKLGEADILKTIDTLMQRGVFRQGHVKSALYGSRDLFNWHLVNSSVSHRILNRRGTPYRYFRIALVCDLDTDETVCGCSVQYTPRFTNRLR